MIILDATVVNVALPHIDADLGFGPASLSWVLNAYTLAFGGLLLLGGRLGDVFGRRRVFEIGLVDLHRRLARRRPGPVARDARRRARRPGRRRRARRPGVLALLTTSAPDEAARCRALALFGAVSSGGMSIGLLLGGAADRRRLVALDAVHQRADRPRRAGADPTVPRRDPAPPGTLRRRRRGDRHRWRRRPRLVPDRRPRARLDLARGRCSASCSRPRCSRCWCAPSVGSRTR